MSTDSKSKSARVQENSVLCLTHRTLDAPARSNELLGAESTGRTPGGSTAASRQMGADDLLASAMSGLDLSANKDPNLGEQVPHDDACSNLAAALLNALDLQQ